MSDRHPIESILIVANALGIRDIAEMPGAWVHKIDDAWTIAVNGQDTTVSVEPDGCMAIGLEPFEFVVWFNGWLAGTMKPPDHGIFAAGTCANTQEFAEATDRFIAEIKLAKASR